MGIGRKRWSTEHDPVMVDTCPYTFVQTLESTPPGMNLNYGLWVTRMFQWKFICCNKRTTLVGDVDKGGDFEGVVEGVGPEYIRNLCTFLSKNKQKTEI